MTSAAHKPTPYTTLPALAREALAHAGGKRERAILTLSKRLKSDAILLRMVIEAAIDNAVDDHVRHAVRSKRRTIMHVTTGNRGSVVALASGWTAAILDMPLANGKKLRNATREEVAEAAERYSHIAADTSHKTRWLRLIAQSVPDGKTVGDVMTDERAAELFKESRNV